MPVCSPDLHLNHLDPTGPSAKFPLRRRVFFDLSKRARAKRRPLFYADPAAVMRGMGREFRSKHPRSAGVIVGSQ
jgi:hypothetical protein